MNTRTTLSLITALVLVSSATAQTTRPSAPDVGVHRAEASPRAKASSQADVKSVFEAQRSHWMRARTLDVHFVNEVEELDGSLIWHDIAHAQFRGGRFRIENHLPGSSGTELPGLVRAFDLKDGQILNKGDLGLTILRNKLAEDGYGIVVPLLQSYAGLFSFQDRTFDRIRDDPSGWDEIAKASKIVESRTVGGYACVVIEAMRQSSRSRTYFAIDAGLLPVRFERFNLQTGNLGGEYDVREVQAFETPDGPVYLPMKAIEVMYGVKYGKPVRRSVYSLVPGKVILNGNIPDEVFTIPRALARSVDDQRDMILERK